MIILYAITGCVTVMFLIVVMSGAIRAMRHPERYGPRAMDPSNPRAAARSRAGGLTRAILDTFPIVKYGRNHDDPAPVVDRAEDGAAVQPDTKKGIEMHVLDDGRDEVEEVVEMERVRDSALTERTVISKDDTTSFVSAAEGDSVNTIPADLVNVDNSTTCPICVDEFTEGDDIRILPCDARHRFHRDCIDPWLLNVSSLCPLCRLDLSRGKEDQPSDSLPHHSNQVIGPDGTPIVSNLRALLHSLGPGGRQNSHSHPHPSTSASTSTSTATPNQEQPFNPSRFGKYIAAVRVKGRGRRAATEAVQESEL